MDKQSQDKRPDQDSPTTIALDLIQERLTQANATLDLLYTLSNVEGSPNIEDLRNGTLCAALNNCMGYIDDAIDATYRAARAENHPLPPRNGNREATTVQ